MGNEPHVSWLSLDNRQDCLAYQRYWEDSRERRPHDHPGFLELVRPDNYAPAVFIYRHADDARISYPFFHCAVNRFAPFADIHRQMRHLVSPYGYGGALYEGSDATRDMASANFEKLLTAELRHRDFVSEFVREDIFSARLARRTWGQTEQQPNVLVQLDRTPEQIWSGYKHAVRGNINRAKKLGLYAVFDRTGEGLDKFLHIYYETMERRGATNNFYFPRDRFLHLADTLGRDNGLMYVHIYDGDVAVASELLLLSKDTIYSFLGGSLASAFSKRPNNLLKHEVILWGAQHGYKWLVLGGGLAVGDELFRYKQSFDQNNIVPFTVRRVIYDQEAYALLVKKRRDYETSHGRDWTPRPGFFPEYLSYDENAKSPLMQQDGP